MRYFILILLTLVLFLRYENTKPHYQDGDKVRITTKVTSEPIRYTNSQYLKLLGLKVYLPLFPEITYGDQVVVEGVVKEGVLSNPELISYEESKAFLFKLRQNIIKSYQRALPEPHSSLLAGVTLGSRSSIPKNFWQQLKSTGTLHVVVASGMNVTLVASFLINVFVLVIPRKKAAVFALCGIWVYALLSGFDAPIIRAAIMGSIAFTAQSLGRLYHAWRGLFLSAYAMLLIKPQWIVDLGFILSFAATVSLMLFERRVRKRISKVPGLFREGLSTSLAAQVGVAPILLFTFGRLSIFSPIVNALVLWTIPGITIIGMIGGLVSLGSIYLGNGILLLSYPLSFWFVTIVELFS